MKGIFEQILCSALSLDITTLMFFHSSEIAFVLFQIRSLNYLSSNIPAVKVRVSTDQVRSVAFY